MYSDTLKGAPVDQISDPRFSMWLESFLVFFFSSWNEALIRLIHSFNAQLTH